MNNIIAFFNQNHQTFQSAVFLVVFLLCWSVEHLHGMMHVTGQRKHFVNNVLFSLAGALVQVGIGIFFLKSIQFEQAYGFGLFHWLKIENPVYQLLITFVYLDFVYWLYHYLMHKIPFLWRFHAVHHSDTFLNVSTALREHPIETLIRLSQYMLAVAILGPPLWLVSLHQFLQVISKIIVHSNFRVPDKTDRLLSYLLLTPNMHQVHHHYVQPYTDSNYGDLFSVWDRIFRTFRSLKKEQLVFGLDQYPENTEKPDQWYKLLKRPFQS